MFGFRALGPQAFDRIGAFGVDLICVLQNQLVQLANHCMELITLLVLVVYDLSQCIKLDLTVCERLLESLLEGENALRGLLDELFQSCDGHHRFLYDALGAVLFRHHIEFFTD